MAQVFIKDDEGQMVATFVGNTLYAGLSFDRAATAGYLLQLAHQLMLPPQMTEERVRELIAQSGAGAFYLPSDITTDDIEGGDA